MKRKLLLLVCAVLLTSLNASAGILDGWTKMETNVITNPQNYYFIILHTDNSLMLGVTNQCSTNEAGTNNSETSPNYDFISYQTASEPCSDLTKVWAIEKCTHASHTSSYTFRSLANVDCPAWSARDATWGPFNLRTNGDVHENNAINAAMNLAFESSYWHIQDAQQTDYFWGPWSDAAYVNNERVAGNAGGNGNAKGSYNIYYMSRSTFNQKYQFFGGTNMNHAIVNRDFEYGTATGWTSTYDQTDFKRSGDAAGSANAEVSPQSGNVYLYLWKAGGPATLTQTVSNLPDGKYSSTIYLCNDMDYYFKGTNAASTGSNTPADTWTEVTVSNQDISDGSADIQVWSWWDGAADNASLTYVPNNVSDDASAYTLGSTTTALTWYSITIPENGDYILTSTAASSILYTTSSTAKPAGTTKATLNAGGKLDLDGLTAGTLYVGTTAATKLALAKATNGDLTCYITNPSFEEYVTQSPITNPVGWDLEFGNGGESNSDRVKAGNLVEGGGSYKLHFWTNGTDGRAVKQTLPVLPAGDYKLSGYIQPENAGTTLTLKAGDYTQAIVTENTSVNHMEVYFTLASAQSVVIKAGTPDARQAFDADKFQLTYNPMLPASLTAVTGKMNSTVDETQIAAVGTYNDTQNVTNLLAAQAAIAAAVESIDIYSTISGIMTTYQDKADALDAAGQAAYTSAINTATTGAASKYNDGTYTTAAEAETAFAADYRTAVKAQVTAGSDMTDAIINPSFETGNISPWTSTDGGWVADNNNWSSGKVGTYFVERWQDGAYGGLSNGTLTQTLTGMPAGRYTLTANAQNIEQQNASVHGTGYFLTLGSAKTEVTSDILTTVTYDLAEAGNLTIGMKLDGCTGNWVSCDNFRLTYVGVEKNVTVVARAGKYGTVILPFAYNFAKDGDFSNIKFYSCASVNNGYTQIVEVLTPAANTPYIIKNNGGSDFSKTISGFSVAEESSYTVGLLTGVYTDAYIPRSDASNSYYVLQTKDDVQAFYKVEDADFPGTPYKCYLTIPAATPVKAFLFPENPTAINAIEAAENENTEIYNLAGQRMSKVQKGVNIINGKKVLVK